MNRREVKSFILYCNFEKQFKLLSMEERGELISAIFEYVGGGEPHEFSSGAVEMAFSFIKDTLDRDREEYIEKCEINTQNGKKGGRPKKAVAVVEEVSVTEEVSGVEASFSASKTERFFEKPKKPYNDNDNDNDNEIDNDIDNGNGKEKEKESVSEADASLVSVPCNPCPKEEGREIITEGELGRLLSHGLSESYVNERIERAASYARERGISVYSLLLEWWRFDQKRKSGGAVVGGAPVPKNNKSYDTDEFFEEALRRTREEFGCLSLPQNDSFCKKIGNISSG